MITPTDKDDIRDAIFTITKLRKRVKELEEYEWMYEELSK